MKQEVIIGNNIEILKNYEDNYFSSIVTDPPYGLGKPPDAAKVMTDWANKGYHEITGKGFMNAAWDAFIPQPNFWREAYRVLKPGGHVLSFFGTRTYDWGVMAMRFAGFEIRDQITWNYSEGMPKGKNISDGFNTSMKPAFEPIVLARKPIEEGYTITENFTKWGTGALNIGESRIGDRYPSNVVFNHKLECTDIYCHPDCPVKVLDDQTGILKTGAMKKPYLYTNSGVSMGKPSGFTKATHDANEGGGSRFYLNANYDQDLDFTHFYYAAKPSNAEKDFGLEGKNLHLTVKPISIMRYLVKLVTPPNGIVLDPFGKKKKIAN